MPRIKKPKKSPQNCPEPRNGAMQVKQPPRNFYFSLIHRFFEPLVTLFLLGKHRGRGEPAPRQPGTLRSVLSDLAFICDYKKGGATTTAIGLEGGLEDAYVFWVAANISSADKIAPFLRGVLSTMHGFAALSGTVLEERKREFVHHCVDFAKPRVKKERNLLVKYIKQCRSLLDLEKSETGTLLTPFLSAYASIDHFACSSRPE